jgi:preprotein translocase subunit SecE
MMNTNTVDQSAGAPKRDIFWWLVIAVIVSAGIVAYYYYHNVSWALRATAGLALTCVIIAIVYQTAAGKKVWQFAKEARIELYKVVWPTRQETIQTSMVIVAMVVVTALILWGVDTVLMWAVSWFTV